MLVASVPLAALATFAREQLPEVRWYLGVETMLSLGWAVLSFVVLCLQRRGVETLGGDLLFRTTIIRPRFQLALGLVFAACFGGLLAAWAVCGVWTYITLIPQFSAVSIECEPAIPILALSAPLLLFVSMTLYVLVRLWWRFPLDLLEIRRHGVSFGGLRFVPWKQIDYYCWFAGKHAWMLRVETADERRHANVLSEERPTVDQLLTEYITLSHSQTHPQAPN